MNEFLMNNNPKNPNIIKSILKNHVPEQPTIINEPEDVEYEEVEVTDDEESESETD
jgi:hypothetical protein